LPPGADPGTIIVTAFRDDAARVNGAKLGLIQETAQAVAVVSQTGGGTVQGVGTGTINNAKDTFSLLRDAGGKLINIATFGTTNKNEAARTDARIEGAIALGKAAVTDPVGTGRKLGEAAIQPFVDGAAKLSAGDRFGGTAQITEAASDTILNAVAGGSKFIAGILTSGVPGVVKGGLPGGSGLDDIEITFGQSINLQGKAFEDALEASGEFGQRLHVNSKTFDFFDPVSGNATSAKTLELLTDPRLRNPKQIYSTLTRYIDQVVDYTGSTGARQLPTDLQPDLIKSKAIVIAVEGGGSKAQAAQIQRAVDYAKGRGLPVQIITVKGKGQ
jgi:hypothetical protein